jgi:hypothetical protein
MPSWANLGPILDLAPGRYKMRTWIKGEDIVQKGGRAWLELRLDWTTKDGKDVRQAKRFAIPQGSFDWTPLEADLEVPANIPMPVKAVLAPVLDGSGSGTIWADMPSLTKLD